MNLTVNDQNKALVHYPSLADTQTMLRPQIWDPSWECWCFSEPLTGFSSICHLPTTTRQKFPWSSSHLKFPPSQAGSTHQVCTLHHKLWHGQGLSRSIHPWTGRKHCLEGQQWSGEWWLLPASLWARPGCRSWTHRQQRDTQAAHWGFHWEAAAYLWHCLWGWLEDLTGLRNSTRYPNAIILQGKCLSGCEHAVLIPRPSSSWIHPGRAVNSLITPRHTKEVLTL